MGDLRQHHLADDCDAEGPEASTYGGKIPRVQCARVRGHEGDHKNGSWVWEPQHRWGDDVSVQEELMSDPVRDLRERVAEAIYGNRFDSTDEATVRWVERIADDVIAATGVMYVGSECQSCGQLQRHTPPPRSCCPEPCLSVPVYRFAGP